MQLYALQDVATRAHVIPLEWSLALTLTGVVLLIPAIIFIIIGFVKKAQKSLTEGPYDAFTKEESENRDSDI